MFFPAENRYRIWMRLDAGPIVPGRQPIPVTRIRPQKASGGFPRKFRRTSMISRHHRTRMMPVLIVQE
jgi:hypothetical protein